MIAREQFFFAFVVLGATGFLDIKGFGCIALSYYRLHQPVPTTLRSRDLTICQAEQKPINTAATYDFGRH